MKIGFTERGDASRDLSWVQACETHKIEGAVIITKTLTNACGEAILRLHQNHFPIVLHATVTGLGGTRIEPGVFTPKDQLEAIQALVQRGFPVQNVVIRVDPILPSRDGLKAAETVIRQAAADNILPHARCRISVLDMYPHARARMQQRNLPEIYPSGQFYASPEQFQAVAQMLNRLTDELSVQFEACAEPQLAKYMPGLIQRGCLSEKDLQLMNLPMPNHTGMNGQNRRGCLCLNIKTELLKHRHPCANQCAYCYWKD